MRIPPLTLVLALLIAGLLVAVAIYPPGDSTTQPKWCDAEAYSEPIPAKYDIHIKLGMDAAGNDVTYSLKEVRMCLTGQLSAEEASRLLAQVRSYVITAFASKPLSNDPKPMANKVVEMANVYLSTQVSPEKWGMLTKDVGQVVSLFGLPDPTPQRTLKGTNQ